MKRVLLHVTCHGIALGLIIAAAITGYIHFAPPGFLFEIIFWFYVLSLVRKRKEARMRRLCGEAGSNDTSSEHGQEAANDVVEDIATEA